MQVSNTNPVTKEILVQKAAEIFAEKGYRATSLEGIASELGVTKPALYYYVKSKKQILMAIFEEILEIYLQSAISIEKQNLSPKEKMAALITEHAKSVLSNQTYSKIFFHEQSELSEEEHKLLKEKMRQYESYFIETYKKGIQEGYFKQLEVPVLIKGIFGMINWSYQWYKENGTYSKEEIINLYLTILQDGYLK